MSKTTQKFLDKKNLAIFKKILTHTPVALVVFLAVALITGSVYIKNIGTFTGPDIQGAHYRASLAAATGQSFTESSQKGYSRLQYIEGQERYFKSGGDCPQNMVASAAIADPLDYDGGADCIHMNDRKLSDENVQVPATLQYPFLSYTPQALGLAIGMSVNMEPVDAQKIARYLNLIAYMFIISIAIVIVPAGRWLVVFISVIPVSLFLASSLSADSLNIAWNMLFVTYLLRISTQKKRINLKQGGIIFILGLGLFMLKVAYVPILLLILGLNSAVISLRNRLLLFLIIALIGSIVYVVWSANWSSLNATVDTSVQLGLILDNLPKAILGILLNILYLPMRIFDHPPLYIVIAVFLAVVTYLRVSFAPTAKASNLKGWVSLYRMQILGVIALVGSLGLTFAALLLTWTDIPQYGWTDIQGFQGRYVLPLLPLLLLAYNLPRKKLRKVS